MSTGKSGLGRWLLPLAALAMAAGLLAGRASAAWGWAAGGAVLALAAVIMGWEDRRRLGLLALVLCLAAVYGWFTWHLALPESRVWHVRGVVSEEIRTVYSRIPGDGVLDWPAILRALKAAGYDGWLSLEYERRWGKQDLPIATEGLPVCVSRLRRWMAEVGV